AISTDSRLIACGCADGQVFVVNASTAELVHTLALREAEVKGVAFADDDKLCIAYANGQISTLNLVQPDQVAHWSTKSPIRVIALAPQGDRLAIAHDDAALITVVRWPGGKELSRITADGRAQLVAFTPSGEELVVAAGAHLGVYQAATGTPIAAAGELGDDFM